MAKPIICLDFDGVVHRYDQPWTTDTEIRDHAVDGFFEWAEKAAQRFRLVIYSSRSKNPEAVVAMQLWFAAQRKRWREQGGKHTIDEPLEFEFAAEKPPAFLTIDDRALTFDGMWSMPRWDPANLMAFKPWNKMPGPERIIDPDAEAITSELKAAVRQMKEQVLIVLLRRLLSGRAGTYIVPVSEIDDTKDALLELAPDTVRGEFRFVLSQKQ